MNIDVESRSKSKSKRANGCEQNIVDWVKEKKKRNCINMSRAKYESKIREHWAVKKKKETAMVQMNFNLVKCFYNFTSCPEQAEEEEEEEKTHTVCLEPRVAHLSVKINTGKFRSYHWSMAKFMFTINIVFSSRPFFSLTHEPTSTTITHKFGCVLFYTPRPK